jgi:SAM-dependent methyltransferase
MTPYEERWLLTQIQRRPWREAMAAVLAEQQPELYARVTDPGQAAILSLLDIADGSLCLDATGGWGELAIPLAARARVVALAPSATHAAVLRAIAAQEDVALHAVAARAETSSFRAGSFDTLLLHDFVLTSAAGLRQVSCLLRPGGTIYLGTTNALARAVHGGDGLLAADAVTRTLAFYESLFAESELSMVASYACFPDHTRPRYFVPLSLVDHFVAAHADAVPHAAGGFVTTYSGLAAERIARHFAPSFAFVLRS